MTPCSSCGKANGLAVHGCSCCGEYFCLSCYWEHKHKKEWE